MSDQTEHDGPAYDAMIDTLRRFLDRVAGARPDPAAISALDRDLQSWSQKLAGLAVAEPEQIFARRPGVPGRGQTMWPAYVAGDDGPNAMRGTVTFGRYFLGSRGAVHGGAIPLLFTEALGRLANGGERPRARTAYLNTSHRALTPVGEELVISARVVSEAGRKLLLRGELHHGETLCADAEGLFVVLGASRDDL